MSNACPFQKKKTSWGDQKLQDNWNHTISSLEELSFKYLNDQQEMQVICCYQKRELWTKLYHQVTQLTAVNDIADKCFNTRGHKNIWKKKTEWLKYIKRVSISIEPLVMKFAIKIHWFISSRIIESLQNNFLSIVFLLKHNIKTPRKKANIK